MAITDNLSCCYEFSSTALLLVDQVNGLTLTNSASPVTSVAGGVIGNAASFTAASSMNLTRASTALLQPGPDLSVEAWVKPTVVNTVFPGPVCKSGSTGNAAYGFYFFNAAGTWRIEASDNSQQDSPTQTITAGVWQQLIGTYNSADKIGRFYLNNGTEQASAALTAGINTGGTDPLTIGVYTDLGAVWYFDGLIDLVRIWKRVLTADERTALYNGGNGLSFLDMIGYPEPINSQMRAGGMVGNINI